MSVASLRRRLSRSSRQSVAGGPSEIDAVVESLDAYKKFFGQYKLKMLNMLQPSTHDRARVALKHFTTQEDKPIPYKYAEKRFGDFASKTAGNGMNRFNLALRSVSSTYTQIADLKSEKESELHSNVFNPNSQLIIKELDNISALHRDLTTAQRNLQSTMKLQSKGDPTASAKIIDAQCKLKEKERVIHDVLDNFLLSEPDRLAIMAKAAAIEAEFCRKSAAVFEEMERSIKELQDDARRNPMKLVSEYENSTAISGNGLSSFDRKDDSQPMSKFGFSTSIDANKAMPSQLGNSSQRTPSCRALHNFTAELAEDLPLTEGDIVTLIKKVDDQWFYGVCNNRTGHFPATFVEVLVPLPEIDSKINFDYA